MKRRHFLQGIAALPVVPAAFAHQPATQPGTAPQPTEETAKVDFVVADAAADMTPHFFKPEQLATLRKLSDIIMPSINGAPGALEAHAPEFLDFLIGSSPDDRKQLYSEGLDILNANSRARYGKPFSDISVSQAETLLAPMRQPWTYDQPADPLARFLRAAKQDVRNATLNSSESNLANSNGGRRASGVGQYWYTIE
jgi:hypothetical protein